jgi:hypothetical protein
MRMTFSSQWHRGRVTAQVNSAKATATKKGLDHLLAASNRLVPVEHGDLKDSGQVVMEGDGQGSVQYGTTPETEAYAVVQHERMDFNHPRGGQAKYLETAMLRESRRIFQIIAQELRRAIR